MLAFLLEILTFNLFVTRGKSRPKLVLVLTVIVAVLALTAVAIVRNTVV
jgi:hypothetical protein